MQSTEAGGCSDTARAVRFLLFRRVDDGHLRCFDFHNFGLANNKGTLQNRDRLVQ